MLANEGAATGDLTRSARPFYIHVRSERTPVRILVHSVPNETCSGVTRAAIGPGRATADGTYLGVHQMVFAIMLGLMLGSASVLLIQQWTRLLALRDAVNGELEKLRQDKVVGTSLEASVTLTTDAGLASKLEPYLDDLPTLFITSAVTVRTGTTDIADGEGTYHDESSVARIDVQRVNATKCPRCWRWVLPPQATDTPANSEICDRCADALSASAATLS